MNKESEWKTGWPTVLAGACGNFVPVNVTLFFALSSFLQPLQQEFGWSRSLLGLAMMSITLVGAFAAPFVGRACDQFGVRKVVLVSLPAAAVALLAISLFKGPLWWFYLSFALCTALGAGTLGFVYAGPIVRRFNRHRGFALGIAFAGAGLAAFALPLLLRPLIVEHGWRVAMRVLSLVTLLQWPIAFFLLRGEAGAGSPVARRPAAMMPVLRSGTFWIIAIPFFLASLTVTGLIINLIPLLTDRGVAAAAAARIASVLGIGIITARLSAGWLVDRLWPPGVAAAIFSGAALGCVGLFSAYAPIAGVSTFAIGFTIGAELDLLAFLISRYFDVGRQGAVFGAAVSVFNGGAVLAPALVGGLYAWSGSYGAGLLVSAAGCAISAGIILQLVRYPPAA